MKRLIEDVRWLLHQRLYVIALAITAVCGYGYEIVTPMIGIDDTAVKLYIGDGLEVVMGRWTVYLLNKVFFMAEYAPFMMEFVGVLLLCMGATLFVVLLRRILGERVGVVAATIFACVYVSNPIISELYIYYYHNGVDFGYLLLALALWLFLDGMEARGREKFLPFVGSMLLAWVASGCYESLLILYILGIILVIFLRGLTGEDELTLTHVVGNLAIGAALSVGIIVLRTLMIEALTIIFGLQDVLGDMAQRNLLEIFDVLLREDGADYIKMLIKRYWVVYFVNGFVYLPTAGYVLSVIVMGGYAIVNSIRRKNIWLPLLWAGMLITPFLLTLMEGQVSYYRSCQFMPFFTATGILLLYLPVAKYERIPAVRWGIVLGAAILVYNQAAALNENFYVDSLKYEDTKEVLLGIAQDVEQEYGTELPVIFTGYYEIPQPIMERYCVSYGSWQYRWITRITDKIDPHIKEKYYTPYGYCYIGEAIYPFIQWGFDAFDGTNGEMIKFLKMHGHSFTTITDKEILEKARELGETMPEWPREGSIREQEGYVLVHI